MTLRAAWRWIVGLGIPLDYLLSILIIVVWFVVASIATSDPLGALVGGCLPLLFPLALIWFSEAIGEFTGFVQSHQVTSESPPALIRILGWIGLLGMIAFQTRHIFFGS